jgi:hypothetical protein
MMHHLPLIKREMAIIPPKKNVSSQLPSCSLQLLPLAEHPIVIGNIEKVLKVNPPRVAIDLVLVPEDRDALVNLRGQGRVAAAVEDRQRF